MRTSLSRIALFLLIPACGEAAAPETSEPVVVATTTVPTPEIASSPEPMDNEGEVGVTFADLAGQWRVTGVAVMEGPVQAVSTNDPAFMDLMIEAGPDMLVWLGKAPNGLQETCRTPVTAPQGGKSADIYRGRYDRPLADLGIEADRVTPTAVECIEGSWGPVAAGGSILFPAGPDVMAMSWYDGAVLRLERTQ